MIIQINNDRIIEVNEEYLCVKDKILFNKQTKKREGLDGDIVSFDVKNGSKIMTCRGTVDGYTCGNKVKLMGVDKIYDNVSDIKFEHISVITNSGERDEELLIAESA